MFNPPWHGGLDGFMYGLDTTHPEVLEHLEAVASSLVEAGFTYLKLDFTFSPAYDGVWHDPSRSPAQRVRAGFDAVRRGATGAAHAGLRGAFILGCGAPLSHVVGVVDGNRIGADVAPSWPVEATTEPLAGYRESQPSTMNAWRNTAARAFMHRRLWLNDPDCLMLRSEHTDLGPEAAATWATAVGVSGGMALVSDDLSAARPRRRRCSTTPSPSVGSPTMPPGRATWPARSGCSTARWPPGFVVTGRSTRRRCRHRVERAQTMSSPSSPRTSVR